jgi:hypothetical protein
MSTTTTTIKRTFFQGIIITGLCLSASAVQATPRAIDSFSSNTRPLSSASAQTGKQKPAVGAAALSMTSDPSPALTWFEKFDALQQKYRPSDSDKVILVRPLMQEAERVRQWIETASKVAKNYKILAKSLKALPTPAGMNDIKEYSNLTADWYDDAASVYVDLIKPRRPAKTIEELQDSLNTIKKKSDSLSSTIANLRQMDFSLRRNYKVHLAMQDDALQQYVRSK